VSAFRPGWGRASVAQQGLFLMLVNIIAAFMHVSFRVLGPLFYIIVFGVVMVEVQSFWANFYFHSPVLEHTKHWAGWIVGFVLGWAAATILIGAQMLLMDLRNDMKTFVKTGKFDES
jgi:hypothetical protein